MRVLQVPTVGGYLGLELRGVTPGHYAILVSGVSNTAWNGERLPLSLDSFGLEGCELYVSLDQSLPIYTAGGVRTLREPLPWDMALAGQTVFLQTFFPDFGANLAGWGSTNAVEVRIGGPERPDIPPLSSEAVDIALDAGFVHFDERLDGGAHTHVFNAGEFGKAAAAYTGDTRVDERLLEQIRYVLVPGNGITATGGFQDQKQVGTTAMFALARVTPRIWDRLTDGEKKKISTMMFGALVSSAFVSSDRNPFVLSGSQQFTLNGNDNLNRDWNANYRNGFLGQVIICSLFFGPDRADRKLRQYDHSEFVASLLGAGLPNLYKTYTRASPDRPADDLVTATLNQGYEYYGVPLTDPMGIYTKLGMVTFSLPVSPGLDGGAGEVGSNGVRGGYVAKSAALPNLGKMGMLQEFDTIDASGTRSSAHYSNDGWYVNNYIHYVLVAYGAWRYDSETEELVDRIVTGTEDLRFKIDPARGGGYHNLQHGQGYSALYRWSLEFGHTINFAVADALRAFHGR